jgi:TolA-binding protein
MRLRSSLLLLLCTSACYPLTRGKDLEVRVETLERDDKTLAEQLTAERDTLRKQSSELQTKLDDLTARLDKLDKASHTADADVGVQIQAVRDDLAQMHGAVEQYQHRIDLLDQGIKDLQSQTDQKLAAVKGTEAVKQLQADKAAEKLQRPTDKEGFLKLADAKAAAGETEVAVKLYNEFLQKWSKDPLAASAHYALGRIAQEQKHEREALSEFGEVVKAFAKTEKAAPALLRSSECFAALGMADASHLALEKLVKDYPKSQESRMAKERLKKPSPPAKKKTK